MSRFIAQDDTLKRGLIEKVKHTADTLHFAETDQEPVNVPEFSRTLWSLQGYLGLAVTATQQEEPKISAQLKSLRDAIQELRRQMLANQEIAATQLMHFQKALFDDIHNTFAVLRSQDIQEGLRIEDLPPALRHRFIGVTGKFMLQVYPKANIWERKHQEEFIFELRNALDPNNTGTPVITGRLFS